MEITAFHKVLKALISIHRIVARSVAYEGDSNHGGWEVFRGVAVKYLAPEFLTAVPNLNLQRTNFLK